MNFDQLIASLRELDGSLKGHVTRTANVGLTLRNWLVGAYIVEFEQNGEERAEYGIRLLPEIAQKLAIRGLNRSNLEFSRRLFVDYPGISQTVSGGSSNPLVPSDLKSRPGAALESNAEMLQALSALFSDTGGAIPQTLSGEFGKLQLPESVTAGFERPEFALDMATLIEKLSFSHFVELLRIDVPLQRAFYEIECVKCGWSVRELKRQMGSLLFERLGLSTDKEKLLRLTSEAAALAEPADIIKDPYVFEFLGLTPKEAFRENDLETALLDHLQDFLLELGNGFCFEDRQKKIRIGSSDYFVDLVFYHRKLHCNVLIELKVEPFSHANAGQLNTYLNYFRKHEMAKGDNPPVGLLLCTDKDHSLVEYALGGMDKNLFVSDYKVALPKQEELEAFLLQKSKNFPTP